MTHSIVEYFHCKKKNGELWLKIMADGHLWARIGPFDTEAERQLAHDDMLTMMRSQGAKDMPLKPQ